MKTVLLTFTKKEIQLLEKIDELRGLIPRATFLKQEIIKKYLLNKEKQQ